MAKTCPECGKTVPRRPTNGTGPERTFCCPAHKLAFQNRNVSQGRTIIALAKAWRISRNRREDAEIGRKALVEMCAILDGFISDDLKAGRPRPTEYADTLLRSGTGYIDRRRR